MNEDSGFFREPAHSPAYQSMELIHSSDGGWTELYRWDKSGRFRVLKALKPEYRGKLKYEEALRKEFEIGYGISHPGICEVYGFININGFGNCIEMEWVDGLPLSEIILEQKVSKEFSRRIITQLCEALSYIHSKQIIHRDIKPANILITHNGQNVKLIDFGLSDLDSSTIFKAPAGTVSFAAPEVLRESVSQADIRSDIYSLGKVISMLSPSYSGVAGKCMKASPDARYQNAEQIIRAVERGRLPIWGIIAISVITISVLLYFLVPLFSPKTELPTDTVLRQEQPAIDTSAIDEIFRQATDMVMSGED